MSESPETTPLPPLTDAEWDAIRMDPDPIEAARPVPAADPRDDADAREDVRDAYARGWSDAMRTDGTTPGQDALEAVPAAEPRTSSFTDPAGEVHLRYVVPAADEDRERLLHAIDTALIWIDAEVAHPRPDPHPALARLAADIRDELAGASPSTGDDRLREAFRDCAEAMHDYAVGSESEDGYLHSTTSWRKCPAPECAEVRAALSTGAPDTEEPA